MDEFQDEPLNDLQEDASVPATEENDDIDFDDAEGDSAEASDNDDDGQQGSDEAESSTTFTPEQQEIFNREINRQIAKRKELEDKMRQLQEAAPQQQHQQPVKMPEMPSMDDYWGDDEGYRKAVDEYVQAKSEYAQYEAQAKVQEEQKRQAEMQRQQEAQKQVQDMVSSYTDKANTFGIDADKMQQEGDYVGQFLNDDLKVALLTDDKGPLVVSYLASNPLELEKFSAMNGFQAGAYLASEIKPKLSSVSKNQKPAPKPAKIVDGAAAPKSEPEILRRAEFK